MAAFLLVDPDGAAAGADVDTVVGPACYAAQLVAAHRARDGHRVAGTDRPRPGMRVQLEAGLARHRHLDIARAALEVPARRLRRAIHAHPAAGRARFHIVLRLLDTHPARTGVGANVSGRTGNHDVAASRMRIYRAVRTI